MEGSLHPPPPGQRTPNPPHLPRMPSWEGASEGEHSAQVFPAARRYREPSATPRTGEAAASPPRGAAANSSRPLFSSRSKGVGGAEYILVGWSPTAPLLHGFSGVLWGMEGRAPLERRTTHSPHSPRKSWIGPSS